MSLDRIIYGRVIRKEVIAEDNAIAAWQTIRDRITPGVPVDAFYPAALDSLSIVLELARKGVEVVLEERRGEG